MRRYELVVILRPSLGEEEINNVIGYAEKIITDENGKVIHLNKWGMKKLAYPIKKDIQGYYVFCDYAGTPAAVAEIERRFRIDDSVLKYLTIKTADAIDAEGIEAAISEMQAKSAAVAKAAESNEAADSDDADEAEEVEQAEED